MSQKRHTRKEDEVHAGSVGFLRWIRARSLVVILALVAVLVVGLFFRHSRRWMAGEIPVRQVVPDGGVQR